jgi:Flp pilus assembly protein TadG
MIKRAYKKSERGAALVEFSICATLFLTVIFGVLEFGRLLWTHNALTDATRRGARYATNQTRADLSASVMQKLQNKMLYDTETAGTTPLVNGLKPEQIKVSYDNYGIGKGSVTVKIEGYQFNFVIPLLGAKINMPQYSTTLPAENAGTIPATL